MSNFTVSVVVATYRRDVSLKNALISLSTQTHNDFEVVVVDDNDNAEWNEKVSSIIDDVKKANPHLNICHIINNPNQGSAKSRNIGINKAQGEYVTFLDDDDVYLPKKIENQYKEMIKTNSDFSITDLELYNEKDKLIENRTRNYLVNAKDDELLKYHLMHHITGTDTMMFKREYLVKIGGFDPIDVGDEFYLMQKAILGGGTFCYLPQCHVKAYVHTGEVGLSNGKGKIDGENRLYEFKKNYFDEIDSKSRRYIKMRHYAVLAFAGLKLKDYVFAVKNGIKSMLCDPVQCIKLCVERKI